MGKKTPVPKIKATKADLEKAHKKRPTKERVKDKKDKAKITKSPSTWLKNPKKYDYEGVDTPEAGPDKEKIRYYDETTGFFVVKEYDKGKPVKGGTTKVKDVGPENLMKAKQDMMATKSYKKASAAKKLEMEGKLEKKFKPQIEKANEAAKETAQFESREAQGMQDFSRIQEKNEKNEPGSVGGIVLILE